LLPRELFQVTAPGHTDTQRIHEVPGVVIKQFMVHIFLILTADAEGDLAVDHVHNLLDVFAQFVAGHVQADGLVAASDVVPDTRRADHAVVRHDAADRHRVSQVVVAHQRRRRDFLVLETTLDLFHRAGVRLAPHRDPIDHDMSHRGPPFQSVILFRSVHKQ
jgi:hypothetical protein